MAPLSRTLTLAFALALLSTPALAGDTPYQKLAAAAFVADLDKQPVSVVVTYQGLADANIETYYKQALRMKDKDRVYLIHTDPGGGPSGMSMAGFTVPAYPVSLPKGSVDALFALKPGQKLRVTGTAIKVGGIGMAPLIHVVGDSYEVVP